MSKLPLVKPGDIIRLTWKDHYRVHNRPIKGTPGIVESFGRVSEYTDEGIALFQNRVTNAAEVGVQECMYGQFVLTCDIIDFEVIA